MNTLTHTLRNKLQNDELKRKLIDSMRDAQDEFVEQAEKFYNQEPRSDESYYEFCQAIVAAVDKVLEAGDWEESLFLRNTIKPLQKLRDSARQLQQEYLALQRPQEIADPVIAEDTIKLYVSLYQANGHDMQRWADQLCSIDRYMVGRPVYKNEEDVQKIIRLKAAQVSEAYAVIAVAKDKIMRGDFMRERKDRCGNALVNVEVGAVTLDNVIEFVHQGKRYHFYRERLVAKE